MGRRKKLKNAMADVWGSTLDPAQKLILIFLCIVAEEQGEPKATQTEIGQACSLHKSSVLRNLNQMRKSGIITDQADPKTKTNSYRIHWGKIPMRQI